MIRPIIYSIGLVFLLSGISLEMLGQTDCSELGRKDRENLAREMIKELGSQSILAIRLQGYQRQIVELDKLIEAATPDSKAQQRLIKRRNEYQASTVRWLSHLQNAFAKYYDQSKVAFYLDHDQALVEDENAEIWLKENGESGMMGNYTAPKLYLVQGSTSKRGLEAFIMKDESFQDVCAPLPAYFKMNSLSTFFLSGEKEEIKKAEKLARSVQAKISELRNL